MPKSGCEDVRHLYVHIPFCPRKCSYCAFETHIGGMKLAPAYIAAILVELESVLGIRPGSVLDTVYFGGGTPSMLSPHEIAHILHGIGRHAEFAKQCEITLEAHPATVDITTLREYHGEGVTRLSFGGESMIESELVAIGRDHDSRRVVEAVALAREAGMESIGLDLMYGLPGQSIASWERTLTRALATGADHLSLYPLSIEPRTVFARRQREGRLHLPADEIVVEMYHRACRELRGAGFEHYEVANWARPGHRCRHNLAYWLDNQYFAVGVGAHGYLKPFRTVNVSGTHRYIDRVSAGTDPIASREFVDDATEREETIMLRLRLLSDGLNMGEILDGFGLDLACRFGQDLEQMSSQGLIDVTDGIVRLREEAVPVANEVWERLLTL